MKNKKPLKLSDVLIQKFDICETIYENNKESTDVLLKIKGVEKEIVLTKQDLQNLLCEIWKSENSADYNMDNYVNEYQKNK
jgi:hypothetical protein